MKRTCVLLLLVGLVATTGVSCGDDDGDTMTPDGSTPTPPPPTPPGTPPTPPGTPPTPPGTPPTPPPPTPPTPPTPTPPTPTPPTPPTPVPPPAGGIAVVDCAGATIAETVSWAIASRDVATTVTAGSIIQWTSADFGHTVTAGTAAAPETTFNERIGGGESVCIRFDTPGTYPYFCAIHPTMTGTVTVE